MNHPYPVLFVSHGAPTFAMDPGPAGAELAALGRELPSPRAIVIVSPHWMTRDGVRITGSKSPETIHDFGGFPAELYRLRYPAPGDPQLAQQIQELLSADGWSVAVDNHRGLDHGAWVPLLHLLPAANVPVVQVSMPMPLDPSGALQLGQSLRPLRQKGVMIIGSGSLTHNLYEFRGSDGAAAPYVEAFADWTANALAHADLAALMDYRMRAPEAARAHPTDEHFLPLFIALGAAGNEYVLRKLRGGVAYGVLAMDSYVFSPSDIDRAKQVLS